MVGLEGADDTLGANAETEGATSSGTHPASGPVMDVPAAEQPAGKGPVPLPDH
ncbi:hypothetical protein TcasGA2_TC031591 [Tribolium castaneum]|uniref:Uncharacterized protein n=1 Tax=Tribolium castaneum TaxID=7070 RepID=A0A139W9D0_TRICA|nr:hypothetical protein TcasGA2_TC031591 [Tribolium castaneum]